MVCFVLDHISQAVLGCSSELTLRYVEQFEPYLQDPTAFPKAQVILSFLTVTCITWLY